MNTFFKLNLSKIKFASIFIAVVSLSFVSIVLIIAYAKGHLPNRNLVAAILLASTIAAPIFIISLAYLGWTYNQFKRKTVFSKFPFSQLEDLGFYKSLKNEKSKWFFTEEIKEGEINGFMIKCDLSEEKSNAIEFEVLNTFREIDKTDYRRLEKLFAEHNAYFKLDTIAKTCAVKKTKAFTTEDLKKELHEFTVLLKQEGFKNNS